MKFSPEPARRKWPCGDLGCGKAAMVTASVLLMLAAPTAAAVPDALELRPHRGFRATLAQQQINLRRVAPAAVPLPKPRPADAPAAPAAEPLSERQTPAEPDKPAGQAVPAPPAASACRLALSEQIAIAPSIPDIHGAGGCGGEDLVRLEAVLLPDQHVVTVTPAAILRCSMAAAVADWIRSDMAPLAASLGSEISDLDNFDSFECRSRNRVVGARLSEHGRANALDVRALKLANGRSIALTDRTVPRQLREQVLQSVCARFSTVLGPGSDWFHEEHVHLDLMERQNKLKICQWNVWDPLPQIAPLLPADRPEQAPPRAESPESDAAQSGHSEPEPDEVESPASQPGMKKRR